MQEQDNMIERDVNENMECAAGDEGVGEAAADGAAGVAAGDVPADGSSAEETPNRQVKRTNCHFCGYLCGFLATVENGRIVDLKVDPTRYPYSEKTLAGCRRWRMNLQTLDAPDRVNYPLKRVGDRGSNTWQRVSWDEALDDIAKRLQDLAEKHGPETLASMIGGPHTSFWPLHRFLNLFGTPNNMGIGQICWNPRIWMDVITFGWTVEADIIPGLTECLFIWGTNPADSDNSSFWQFLREYSKEEMGTLVVIDPCYTRMASLAARWIPVLPGTDVVFALSLLNVIIEEDLYDHEFVETWCHGFDELARHVKAFPPAVAAPRCGVSEDDIYFAARAFANARASALVSGRGIDQVGRNVSPCHRAICCLRAITGNLDKPGSCVIMDKSDFVPEVDLEMTDHLAPEHRARSLNSLRPDGTPLQSYPGFEFIRQFTERIDGKVLPERYLTAAHPDFVLHAMETGEPYPVRALIVEATNPLLTYGDTHRVFNALMSLDLIVVLDYFMSITASIADYVLPAAQAMERPTFQAHGGVANIGYGGPAAVEPYYERKTDYDFFRLLGLRLGQAEFWPDETFADALRTTLAPAGMSYEEYCETGIYTRKPDYYKHLRVDESGRYLGFGTSTGLVELASEELTALGGQRLPLPGEPAVLCTGDTLLKGPHLKLVTGSRKQPYNASMYFNNAAFRKQVSVPAVEMSAATAEKLGFAAGDCVYLGTDNGQARFQVKLAKMRDDLLSADYGWWHPEYTPGAPDFGGMWESNINCLTSCARAEGEEMIGTWSYNNIDCVIWKSDEPLTFSYEEGHSYAGAPWTEVELDASTQAQ